MGDTRMRVERIAVEEAEPWSRVGGQEIFVSDKIDEGRSPDAKMTVGFARLAKGETFTISFPYDEVLIVTKGAFTVDTDHGERVTARAGEVIYLPGGTSNTHRAEEATEMVYVAAPPDVYARHVAASADQVSGG